MSELTFTSKDLDLASTEVLAAKLALKLQAGDIVALIGPLGVGKSAFARQIIRTLLTDKTQEVPSPTFTLVQPYERSSLPDIYHCDLYRLSHEDELHELALDDVIDDSILIVEWPEKLPNSWLQRALKITFTLSYSLTSDEDNYRVLRFDGPRHWKDRGLEEGLMHG